MKKLGFLVMPLMVVSFLANCNQPTPAPVVDVAHTFHFLGTNCTINGENDYSHDIFEKDKNVQYTIIADDDYALPETIESDISYERTDEKVAVITINEIKADIVLNIIATFDPSPTQKYPVHFIGDGCAATLSTTSESFTYDLVKAKTEMSLTIASDDIDHHKLPSSSSNIGFTINGKPASPTSYVESTDGTYLLKFTVIGNTTIHIKASDICTVTVHNNVPDAAKPTEKYVLDAGDIFHETTAREGLPTYDFHTLVGWYTDEGFARPYDFTLKVFEDIDLYVCWAGGDVDAPLTFVCVDKAQGGSEEDPLYLTLYNNYEEAERNLEYRIIKNNNPTPGDWIKVGGTGTINLPITTYDGTAINFLNEGTQIDKGDKIQLRGNNNEGWSFHDEEDYKDITLAFATNQYYKFDISNNVMSLINYDNFAHSISIPNDYCFCALFSPSWYCNNDYYTNFVEAKYLCLPATTLTNNCYSGMFASYYDNIKTPIVSAPELPAITLAKNCYDCMFDSCTALTVVPTLPATDLADSCYMAMFDSCTALTVAPELPATDLADNCYNGMFRDCTSLETAPVLSSTNLAYGCYGDMFNGCTSLETAPVLSSTNLAYGCYGGMFKGCTALTVAPTLPATDLADNCYNAMFMDCTSLETAPTLSSTNLAEGCYRNMFWGCRALTNAPELPAADLKEFCYGKMFYECIALTTAPELPATNLVQYCYKEMFAGCSSLEYLKVGFGSTGSAVWPDEFQCTKDWLKDAGTSVINSPTLYWKGVDDPNRTLVVKDDDHAPDGWSVSHWE